jgi:hypothetical protein
MVKALITKYDDWAFFLAIAKSLEKNHKIVFLEKNEFPDDAVWNFEFEGVIFSLRCTTFLGTSIITLDNSPKALVSLRKLADSIVPPSYPL